MIDVFLFYQACCLAFVSLSVYQRASLFRLPAGGAAGGGYAQVIPMEEVSEYRHPVSYYHKRLQTITWPQNDAYSVTDKRF